MGGQSTEEGRAGRWVIHSISTYTQTLTGRQVLFSPPIHTHTCIHTQTHTQTYGRTYILGGLHHLELLEGFDPGLHQRRAIGVVACAAVVGGRG